MVFSSFRVKELFYTIQGEGMQAGRAAVFCRFTGCNLWSGRARDKATAKCPFCDTDFVGTNGTGGGVFEGEAALAAAVESMFPEAARRACTLAGVHPYVVFTGGEPALQLTATLVEALHLRGFDVGVETNGTLPLPPGLDWIAVSPKAGTPLVTTCGHELKLVWPQQGITPETFANLNFTYYLLQPCDSGDCETNRPQQSEAKGNTQTCIDYCLANPLWRLSLQTHKFIGVR